MIDIALRERQFAQVLGFLDEQLGDSDVTIVFGDAAGDRAYFVSNRPLHGHQRHGGIYVRDAGKIPAWYDLTPSYARKLTDIGHMFRTAGQDGESLSLWERHELFVSGSYAWSFSETFWHMFNCPPYTGYEAPEDANMCHEAAHGILLPHNNFLLTAAPDCVRDAVLRRIFHTSGRVNDAIDEAVAQRVSFVNCSVSRAESSIRRTGRANKEGS